MAIVNNYAGFTLATSSELQNVDQDSDFGANLNRSIQRINTDYNIASGITNTYAENYSSQFGASSNFSTNEQRLIQNMIRESININGITVRYMPRNSIYEDKVWNERPESTFHKGLEMDMILVAAAGFEGEGDVMTQYGVEFREEVIMSMAIPRFDELYTTYENSLSADDLKQYNRQRPLEGDLIVIPFGRSSNNRNNYVPKIFEITRVTTYHDGAFFQLGDNYQYKIKAKLFELSGEDLLFNPRLVEYNKDGTTTTLVDSDTGKIARVRDLFTLVDSETGAVDIAKDSEAISDSWGDNHEIEKRAQEVEIYNSKGEKLQEKQKVLIEDLSSKVYGLRTIISNLDDI